MKNMKNIVIGFVMGIAVSGAVLYSQSRNPVMVWDKAVVPDAPTSITSREATDITPTQIEAVRKLNNPTVNRDRLVKVVDIGPYNVSLNVQHRVRTPSPEESGSMHMKVTEIYYVLDGSATLVTGGTLVPRGNNQTLTINPYDPKTITPEGGNSTGPGWNGKTQGPVVTREIGPGSVVIIPPMTNHYFSKINGHIDFARQS